MLRRQCGGGLLLRPNLSVVALGGSLAATIRARRQRIVPLRIISAGNHEGWHMLKSRLSEDLPSSSSSNFRMTQTVSSPSQQLIELGRWLKHRSAPELGLLSVCLVLSTAIGAIISLAIISIPTMSACKRLNDSMDKLSKVVSREVPGTFFSLKLSALEINDLTQRLSNLRQMISGSSYRKKDRKQ